MPASQPGQVDPVRARKHSLTRGHRGWPCTEEAVGAEGKLKAKVVGEVLCCVRDGRLDISIPVVCVRVGGPQSIVYCNASTSRSHHTGYPPCGGSRGGCRWDTCRGRG